MALHIKSKKRRLTSSIGKVNIKTFITPVSEGCQDAITITVIDSDNVNLNNSITLYGNEVELLKAFLKPR